ncbi:hypothetical protein QMO56_02115 [Roseomonas sp. E05]|uniref:hypothetical protein n=1 Tax=Roseomonas sp. E05 TaxID=3046310 RepID=UPI0024B9B364|nr:hypothetical protein [Roseomonas sp. E05]MDJ0386896.1 hypothetical protein [Roseomonas sp. E05]
MRRFLFTCALGLAAAGPALAQSAGTSVTYSSGEFVSTTQVNMGKPGQMGIATSVSGGFSGNTNVSNPFGSLSGSGTMVLSRSIGMALGGGSFNVGSSVVSSPTATLTTAYGGQYTFKVTGPSLP